MDIEIVEYPLTPEEQERRMKRFFEIILEADLKTFRQLSEESNKQRKEKGPMNIRIELLIEPGETKAKREYVIPSEDDSLKQSKQVDGIVSDRCYVDIKFLSSYIGFKEPTIRDWIRFKKIPFLRIEGGIRFDLHQIDEWLKGKNQISSI